MRVLKPEGLLLAKITDMVNNHRSKWAHCDFMQMATDAGFVVCDLIVKVRTGPMVSTKWRKARHARKRHCFWIVCRKSTRCEPRVTWAEAGNCRSQRLTRFVPGRPLPGSLAAEPAIVPFRLQQPNQGHLGGQHPPVAGEGQIAKAHIGEGDVLAPFDLGTVLVQACA